MTQTAGCLRMPPVCGLEGVLLQSASRTCHLRNWPNYTSLLPWRKKRPLTLGNTWTEFTIHHSIYHNVEESQIKSSSLIKQERFLTDTSVWWVVNKSVYLNIHRGKILDFVFLLYCWYHSLMKSLGHIKALVYQAMFCKVNGSCLGSLCISTQYTSVKCKRITRWL